MKQSAHIGLVIFDMDGTLTKPYLDFYEIRKSLGIEGDTLTLDWLRSLDDPVQRERGFRMMQDFEDEAADNAELQPGAYELIDALHDQGIQLAIQTRNSRRSVDIVFNRFDIKIERIFTRENAPPKPDPQAANQLLDEFGLSSDQGVFVGDFWPDIETGRNAGMHTVLLTTGPGPDPMESPIEPEEEIKHLLELLPLIERWNKHESS